MRRWSIWKKLVVYPLIVVLPLLAILAWVVIAETVGEPRLDDAPRVAAMFLGFAVFCLYCVYLACLGITKVIISISGGPKSEAKRE